MTYYQIWKVREYLYGQATKKKKKRQGESIALVSMNCLWGRSYEPGTMYEIIYS
jgi:hypothetical protein